MIPEIKHLERTLQEKRQRYLRQREWSYKSNHPHIPFFSQWMWSKDINGQTYVVSESQAIHIQEQCDAEDVNTFLGQAYCLLRDIENKEALTHWLWEQDFFINLLTNQPLSDANIARYMEYVGANKKEIRTILEIVHREKHK